MSVETRKLIKAQTQRKIERIADATLMGEADFEQTVGDITQLIKDADHLARCRCADAVRNCDGEMDADIKLITANDAARACLNA